MTDNTDTPPWRTLIESAYGQAVNKNTASYVQLATNDAVDGAQVRTMVWRGFEAQRSGLLMATDIRSAKVNQVGRYPRAQLVWYFSDTREQFRCSGTLSCIGPDSSDQTLRRQVWQGMSSRARQSFYATTSGEAVDGKDSVAPHDLESANYFAVLNLEVDEVDHLDVSLEPNRRVRYRSQTQGWLRERIQF